MLQYLRALQGKAARIKKIFFSNSRQHMWQEDLILG